jgi:hypothetical protein
LVRVSGTTPHPLLDWSSLVEVKSTKRVREGNHRAKEQERGGRGGSAREVYLSEARETPADGRG